MPFCIMGTERKLMYKSNCIKCNKEIEYSPFAFDGFGNPTGEYAHITNSGLCTNGIDGCWENHNL